MISLALASVAFSISAFAVAAILSGLFLLGKDKGEGSNKTLGVINTMVGISIFISSLLLFLTTPFGTSDVADKVQLMFSALQVFFAFVWVSFGCSLLFNWDMKFIGSLAMVLFIYNIIAFFALPTMWSAAFSTGEMVIVEVTLLSYLFDEAGFWSVTHGKMSATPQGYFLIISGILSILLALIPGGIFPI